ADQTATISGTLAISSGATAYIYVRYDLANGTTYPTGGATVNWGIAAAGDVVSDGTESGSGTLAGTQTVRPNVTSISYPQASDGGRNGDTFSVSGAGFGTVCASFAAKIQETALTCVSANNTIATTTIPSGQTTTYGGTGTNGLLVTVGGAADDARQTFYVYPFINNVASTTISNADRESASIILTNSTANNARFGSSGSPTVVFTGGFGSVNATVTSWADTSVTITVPTGIANNVYLGDITLTRNATDGNKADNAYDSNGFRILPTIATSSPINLKGGRGETIGIGGDHLCQSGTCPTAFSAADSVNFNGGSVTSGASAWTDTYIPSVVIPATANDGNMYATSSTSYGSNNLNYDIKFGPSTPTGSSGGGSNNPALSGTAFSDSAGDSDTHYKTTWQIAHNTDADWLTPEWTRTSGAAEVGTTVNTTNGTFANGD
ncbi:MAG: hypothetical protein AAB464_00525, partial [Patescibacteria group bacterium]